MLYPLSYEGLRCTFAQRGGRVLVCRARAGCLAPDGLCRTCAACREPADPPPSRHAAPIVRRVVPSQEPEARLSNEVRAGSHLQPGQPAAPGTAARDVRTQDNRGNLGSRDRR